MSNQEQSLEKIVEELLAERPEFFLVELSLTGPVNRKKITLFIDKDTGITIDECGIISQALEEKIEAAALFSGAYTIEVSSPGMDSSLKVVRQYRRRIGQRLHLLTTSGVEHKVVLKAVYEDHIVVENLPVVSKKTNKKQEEGPVETFTLPYTEIKKCHLIVSFK